MSVSTTGVVIDGDIATKPHKKIPRLPFKISRVSEATSGVPKKAKFRLLGIRL
jgi:hypothetical protein